MANPTWPGSLGWFKRDGFQEQPGDNRIVNEMDSGPPKIRKKATTAPGLVAGFIEMSSDEWDTFFSFYESDCEMGCIPFDGPGIGVVGPVTWWFNEVPSRSPIGVDWEVSISLMRQAF